MIVNAAVTAPTPSAATRTTVAVNPGERRKVRAVYRRSCRRMSTWTRAALPRVSKKAPAHRTSVAAGPELSRSRRANSCAIGSPYSRRKDAG